MNDTPDNHVLKDLAVARAEDKLQQTLAIAASDWIVLKEVRLSKLFRSQHLLLDNEKLSPEYQKLQQDFIREALLDPDFQTGAVTDDICARLDELISNQVNARFKS